MEQVSLAVAFVAGVASFASPCVLALLPVYLAFLGESAATTAEGGAVAARGAVLPQALLFVLGFTAVFVLLGTSIGLLGGPLFRVDQVRQAAGAVVVLIGVLTTGVAGPVLARFTFGLPGDLVTAARPVRSLALGAVVSIGWTPCIGPALGAILSMGASTGSAPVAALLLTAYSAGLALPFLVAAVGLPQLTPLLGLLRRNHRIVEVISGVLIIGIGVLIYVNAFGRLASLFANFGI
jgi:cytochrome c-type biogenesis protein